MLQTADTKIIRGDFWKNRIEKIYKINSTKNIMKKHLGNNVKQYFVYYAIIRILNGLFLYKASNYLAK